MAKGNPRQAISAVYMIILSRDPTEDEVTAVLNHVKTAGLTPEQGAGDLAWALINTKEFLYRH
jgi:hypothetical protein